MVTSYGSNYDVPVRDRPTYSGDGRKYGKRAKPGEVNHAALFEAMRYARRRLEAFRTERTQAVREYVGRHYSDGGAELKVPINLIARYVQVISRSLVPKTPRIMLSTKNKDAQPSISAMQDWLNQRLVEMHFAQTLQRWVVDSLFCIGIMKVALGTPADAAISGYISPAGVPFAETVDVDDFVVDWGCRDFRQASFIGHRYRIPCSVAENLDYFDGKAKKWLAAAATSYNSQSNQEGDERITAISTGWTDAADRDYEDMVDLWEVYLPRQKRVVTYASDCGGVPAADCPPLRNVEWVGPDCGPYHFLSLMPVPGNAMPKAPIQDLIDLHQSVNAGVRKLIGQMMRQKTVLPVRGGAVDDGKNLLQTSDGEMFRCENADAMKEVSFGGPSPINAQFTTYLGDVFNKMAGNLDLLSGASPQSKTATQDKILAENSGAGVADMQEHTITGISKVVDALNWYWWYHPQEVMKTTRSIPGAEDIKIERKLYPANYRHDNGMQPALRREGRYEDLMCRVDPYSLVYRTPQQRLDFLNQFVQGMLPMMPILAPQGIQFDAMAFVKMVSEYADEPDVLKLFTVAEPTPQPQGGDGGGPKMPTQTSREYIRRSVGQDTEANRNSEFDNMMSEQSAGPQG